MDKLAIPPHPSAITEEALHIHCPRVGPGPLGPRAGPGRPPEGQGLGQTLCGPGPVWQGQGPAYVARGLQGRPVADPARPSVNMRHAT